MKRISRTVICLLSIIAMLLANVLPVPADYLSIDALRLEAREKLQARQPLSLGQASRIPGVNPADIAVLMVWLKRQKG